MKRALFSTTHAFSIAFILFILIATNGFSQAGIKWNVTGNIAASGDFLGTTNNEDLIFKTNNATAFKIKANGNIILKSLEGFGDGLITIDNNGKAIHIPFTGDGNQVLLGNGTFGFLPGALWSYGSGGKIYYNGGKVGIGTTTPNFMLDVDGDVRITQNLYLQGGLVISEKIETPKQMKARAIVADSIIMDSTKAIYGITNFKDDVKLQSKLSVNGNTKINGIVNISSLSSGTPLQMVLVDNFGNLKLMGPSTPGCVGTLPWMTGGNTIGTIAESYMGTCNSMPLIIGTNTIERMRVTSGGYIGIGSVNPLLPFHVEVPSAFMSGVGIGTTSIPIGTPFYVQVPSAFMSSVGIGTTYIPSGYKLSVEGKIICEEVSVKLRASWPDYVFEENYKLTSLEELEKYIKLNKHLPEISSAEEIEKNGINTSEMITKLLKNQEELILYIIEQNKKIELIQKQIEAK